MKIALVVHGYPPEIAAGTERVTERLALDLRGRGHEVFVICGTFEPKEKVTISRREQAGVQIIQIHRDDLYFDRWEKTYHPGVSKAFAEILKEIGPDVVHVHQFIRLTRDLAHQATLQKIPVIYTLHDFATTCLIGFRAPNAGKTFCDLLPNANDCIPCAGTVSPDVPAPEPSEFELLRKDFVNELRLSRFRCAISGSQRSKLARYHRLPEDFFSIVPLASVADLPAGMPAPEPPPLRAATFGMQMERKGAHIIINAAAAFGGAVELDIFGKFDNPEYETRCRAMARGLPVRFHGRYEWDEVAATPLHVTIFPSLTFETFGLTFDESWALGHPVVATDLGAYRERADASTLLFPPGDVDTLRRILKLLLNDSAMLARLRAAVRPPSGFGRYVNDMERLYKKAVELGPADPGSSAFQQNDHPTLQQFAEREELFRRRLSGAR